MDLSGTSALVTGGHRRVGRAIAKALRGAGAEVHFTWLTSEAEAEAASQAGDQGHRVDLADAAAVKALASDVWEQAGRVHMLVNTAAIFPRTPVGGLRAEDFDRCHAVNLRAPAVLAVELGRRMKAAGGGAIVNITDWATARPYAGYAPYFASKAALEGLTRSLAIELAPEVRVNAVAPGAVLLPEGTTDAERAAIKAATPIGRIGLPEDVAAAVLFLLAGTSYATGSVVHIDGGRQLGG
jgi:pteridine reductase